jgi:hypothetical protein
MNMPAVLMSWELSECSMSFLVFRAAQQNIGGCYTKGIKYDGSSLVNLCFRAVVAHESARARKLRR